MKKTMIVLSVMLVLVVGTSTIHNTALAQYSDLGEDGTILSATGILSDGTMVVFVILETIPDSGFFDDGGEAGERIMTVTFTTTSGDNAEHVNYDILVTQNENIVLKEDGIHDHDGIVTHKTSILNSDDPVDITIIFQGYGIDTITGPVGEEIVFANVVSEFGTMETMMATVVELDQLMAEIVTSDGIAHEEMSIDLTLTDLEGNGIEHITYNIKATQGSAVLLDEEGHMHKGIISNNHVTSALPLDASSTMPVVITVESVGFGHDTMYVDFPGEIATKQVVPEFGTIAMMILSVAIISIVAITEKSRLSIIPRI